MSPGRLRSWLPLGEAEHEARARAAVVPVLDEDRPVMALHRRLGDREAETRMAAESLALRAKALEAAEYLLARFRRHAGPFILDGDDDDALDPAGADLDEAARRGEGDGVVDQIVERPGETRFLSQHRRRS